MATVEIDVQLVAAAVASFAGVAAGFVALNKFVVQPVRAIVLRARLMYVALDRLCAEMSPNGGSTLRDAINRIELALAYGVQVESIMSDALGIALWKSDKDGACIWASPKLCETLGLPCEDVLQCGWINGIRDEDRKGVMDAWAVAVKERRRFDHKYRTKAGKRVHGTAIRVLMGRGDLVGYVGMLREIPEDAGGSA